MVTMSPFTPQTISLNPTPILWGSVVPGNSTFGGIGGLQYINNGSFMNTTLIPFILEVQYSLYWNQSINGYTYLSMNGAQYGYTQYSGRLITNSVLIILHPNVSFNIFCQNSSDNIVLLSTSTITITSLSVGPMGPTGITGSTGFGVRNSVFQNRIIIDGIIAPPTFTNITVQQISYRLLGDKWRLTYKMGWAGSSNAGSGDYLVNLPTGISFNFNGPYDRAFTGRIFPADYSTIATATIPANGGIIESLNWSTSCYVIPYDSQRFRLVLPYKTQLYKTQLQTWNSTTYGVNNALLSIEFEIWAGL
jgi:hypothetical protein